MPTNQDSYRKRQPQRTCLGCRKTSDKGDLIRIVRTPEGDVKADPGGKMNGRGAYICADKACLTKALKTGALSRALRCSIPEELAEELAGRIDP